jgi:hypothetical protein
MENVKNVTTPAAPVSIPLNVIEARNNVVKAETGSYGAKRNYAAMLNNAVSFAWMNKDSEKSPLIEAERQSLMSSLKAANHSNPHKVWADVKKYAIEDAQERGLFGMVKPEPAESGEAESTGNANINAPRPLQLRLVEELTALYKVCDKEKAFLTDKQRAASLHITKALEALGVNLGLIKTGK